MDKDADQGSHFQQEPPDTIEVLGAQFSSNAELQQCRVYTLLSVSRGRMMMILMTHTHTTNTSLTLISIPPPLTNKLSSFRTQACVHDCLLPVASMPLPTRKSERIALLNSLGHQVDDNWTVLQMKALYSEVKEQRSEKETRLNSLYSIAKEKRSDLAMHLSQDLGLVVSSNATKAQMVALAEKNILERFEPEGTDKMGFGQYAAKTMDEVVKDHPTYVLWAKQMMEDPEEVGWRLKRFARYAEQAHAKGKGCATINVTKGYQKPSESSKSSDSSFSVITANKVGEDQTFDQKDEELKALRQELEELKKEKEDQDRTLARSKNRKEMWQMLRALRNCPMSKPFS